MTLETSELPFAMPDPATGHRPSAGLMNDFFEQTNIPMRLVAADGVILRANRAELDMLGYAATEYVGRSIANFHVDPAVAADFLARLARGEQLRNRPADLRAKDGSIRHVIVNSGANFQDGVFVNTWCASVDLTELKDARAAANDPEGQSSKLLEALPVPVYTTDSAGRITYFNEAAADLWGCRPALGKSEFCGSWKLYWPDGTPMPHDECPMAITLRERRPVRGMEAIAERPDGTRVPFAPFPTPLFGRNGEFVGGINLLVDLSALKQLQDDNSLLASVVNFSNDAIISMSLDGIILSWNMAAERIYGYAAAEIVGRSVMLLIPDDRVDEERMILDRLKRGELIEHYETRRRRKDGELIYVSLTISPVKNADATIVGASKIARDISERKKNEERMLILAREVDHRANNLLAVVQAAFELTQADTVENFKTVMRGRISALAHAHRLLSGSRWEGADLRTLIEDELQPYHSDERIRLTGENAILKPEVGQSFALLIHELATNAAKYGSLSSPDGTLAVEWTRSGAEIRLRWTERGGPPVSAPVQKGFGTRVMERMVQTHPGGSIRFDWQRDGLVCDVTVPAGI